VGVAGRVARGSFIILARDVIANFAAFLGVAIVARVLGPGEYGLASVALVYPGLVGAVVGLGLGSAITRFASSGGTSAGRYVYSGLWASAASGAAGAVVLLALAPLFASLLNRPGIAFGVSRFLSTSLPWSYSPRCLPPFWALGGMGAGRPWSL